MKTIKTASYERIAQDAAAVAPSFSPGQEDLSQLSRQELFSRLQELAQRYQVEPSEELKSQIMTLQEASEKKNTPQIANQPAQPNLPQPGVWNQPVQQQQPQRNKLQPGVWGQ
jgi:hypothetical protein